MRSAFINSIFCKVVVIGVTFLGCRGLTVDRRTYSVSQVSSIDRESKFLKIHLHDGRAYTFSRWEFDEVSEIVRGQGELRNANRTLIRHGIDSVALDQVALFETNKLPVPVSTAGMTVVTVGSGLLSLVCLTNPKACFGSCPTFYAWNGEEASIQAEGFSASVLPVLEDTDIDPLYTSKAQDRRFEIRMTNEALETHVVRSVNVLAVGRNSGGRVFLTPKGKFLEATHIQEPASCISPEGDCLKKVRFFDDVERFGEADSSNLAAREVLEITFDGLPPGKVGLIVGFRQSLMSTYLFYQQLAYLGTAAGEWLAKCERSKSDIAPYLSAPGDVLGGIEVIVKNNQGEWVKAGEIYETGPIAKNIEVVPLIENLSSSVSVRLRMTKGLWRLNYIALGSIQEADAAERFQPIEVWRRGAIDVDAKEKLTHQGQTLVTVPGDEYLLVYLLPEEYERYELFLESRGYYIEWMREEWLQEENIARALRLFTDPEEALKEEASRYKNVEPLMEESFWRSKYVRRQ